MAEIDVRIRLRGGNREVRNALRGIVRASEDTDRQVRRSSKRTADDHGRQERRKSRVSKRVLREIVNDVKKAEREKRKEAERTAREFARNEKKKAREAERAARDQSRARKRFGLAAAGGLAVAGGAALGRVRSFQGAAGIRTREELFAESLQFRQRFIGLSNKANFNDAERASAQRKILSTSRSTGVDPTQLLVGLEVAQEKFDDARGFMETLDSAAKLSRATSAGMEDVVATLGIARRQFGLTKEEVEDFTGVLVEAGNRGNIDFPELANAFSGALGNIRRGLGERGKGAQGAADAIVLAQLIGSGDTSPDEAATRVERFLMELNRTKTQKAINKELGIKVADDQGNLQMGIFEILQKFAESDKFQSAAVRQEVFREIQGRQGAEILVQSIKDNPEDFKALRGISPKAGHEFIDRTVRELNQDASGKVILSQADQMSTFIENSKGLMDTFNALSGPLAKLEAEFPLVAEAAGIVKNGLMGLGGTLIGLKAMGLLGGGAAAAAGAGSLATGAAGAGGAAAVGGGTLAALGSAALPLAAAATGIGVAKVGLIDPHLRALKMQESADAQKRALQKQLQSGKSTDVAGDLSRVQELSGLGGGGRRKGATAQTDVGHLPFFRSATPTVKLDEETVQKIKRGENPLQLPPQGSGGAAFRE